MTTIWLIGRSAIRFAQRSRGCSRILRNPTLGKHKLGKILPARPVMVRQDQTRRVHERSRGNPQRVPGCERRINSCLMTPNHKLTNVIKGRLVEDLQMNPAEVSMRFSDGSTMRVKVMESNSPPLKNGARIRAVS